MSEHLFSGLKVIDCASWIAGPAAATIMSDFGADVIKIEPPGAGDPWRSRGANPNAATDYYWQLTSRNKRSLALDLKQEAGLAVLYRLVEGADVFVTNFPLPVRDRLKLAPADLLPLNNRLIYASFTAYGEAGDEAAKTGFDSTAYWARTGLMDAVRADVDTHPARSAPGMGDHPSATGLYAAIVTALYRREKTGRGGLVQFVAAGERIVGQRLLRADATVRRAGAAPSTTRGCAERAREPLSLPRRSLVHHGAVQRGTAAAPVPVRNRSRRTGQRSPLRHETGAPGELVRARR